MGTLDPRPWLRSDRWLLQFLSDNLAIISEDGQEIAHGSGVGRAEALLEAWGALRNMGREDAAAWVAERYQRLTGDDPSRLKIE